MQSNSHTRVTEFAFETLRDSIKYYPLLGYKQAITQQARDTDFAEDLELIDVEGADVPKNDGGRDNPHDDELFAFNDVPHYFEPYLYFFKGDKRYFTAFNHFIDIRKGKQRAIFDDFDGYSYRRGSGSEQEHEDVELTDIGIMKVDHGVNYWLNDEYVHAPGQKWYREETPNHPECSPSISRYSFRDIGIYPKLEEEARARFPLADSTGGTNKGVPYSVFMPLDNMARYWYGNYMSRKDPRDIGYVMHAIQDASIPHHAAGYLGNWHAKYEEMVDNRLGDWLQDPNFQLAVMNLFSEWNKISPTPPTALDIGDENKIPHRNWDIQWLVTWMALNSYNAYKNKHNSFVEWKDDPQSMRQLTIKAAALCMLVLYKASIELVDEVLGFDPQKSQIKNLKGVWCVTYVTPTRPLWIIERFKTQDEATKCLDILQHYKMDRRIKIRALTYYLSNGDAPTAVGTVPSSGQQTISFNPNNISIKFTFPKRHWVIVEDAKEIVDFGGLADSAQRAFCIIQLFGFNQYCWLGNQNSPTMEYFLRNPYGPVIPVPSNIP